MSANGAFTFISPRFKGCSSISQYEVLDKLGEGTFGEVHKARSVRTKNIVALKKILMHHEKEGFPITALREIKLLKMLSHVNILKLEEMAIERPKGKERKKAIMYMVTPYMEHDLSGLLENPAVNFTEAQIKCYMLQLLEGVRYLHNSKILHRDMKAANLLINNRGILQIADFGLARHYDEPAPLPGRGGGEARREYTALVVTRWYRPPELLLSLRQYTTAIDMWGVGCVFGEMFKRAPILAGKSDLNQIQIIFDLVGSPTEENMPGWSSLPGCEGTRSFTPRQGTLPQTFREIGPPALSLLRDLLRLDWRRRLTAIDALQHPYFRTPPLPASPASLPTYDDSHELDRRKFRGQKAALPPAPAGGAVGEGPNGEWASRGAANGGGAPRPASRGPPAHGSGPGSRGAFDTRGPPQDSRRPVGAPSQVARPGWAAQQPRPDSLPPRPPVAVGQAQMPSNGGESGGRSSSQNQTQPRTTKDTYIPSYSKAKPEDDVSRLPSRDDRDRDRDRDRNRDRDSRDRDSRDRDNHRGNRADTYRGGDRDRERGGGLNYGDRESRDSRDSRDRDTRDSRDRSRDNRRNSRDRDVRGRRSRSRSPNARDRDRSKDSAPRRDREKDKEREGMFYRR